MTASSASSPFADPQDRPLVVAGRRFVSRLVVGTGKYKTYAEMAECLAVCETECVTVAVRRERLLNDAGVNILDHLDTSRYTLLPNTAGCFSADDAIRDKLYGGYKLSRQEWEEARRYSSRCQV